MGSTKKTRFDILRRPRITEKSASFSSGSDRIVFEVHPDANKQEIREAVERIFDVKVKQVRTANFIGKIKRVRTHEGQQRAWKKAYITLQPGSSLNVIQGL